MTIANKRVFQPLPHWTTEFVQATGAFDDLNVLFDFNRWQDFPSCEWLTQQLPKDTQTRSGQALGFIRQDEQFDFAGRAYETVIYQTGEVPTRVNSWHDLFGGLIWCLFPKTKALMNQLHHQDIADFGDKVRTKTRNAITLLDECGVIMAVCDDSFKPAFRDHLWHQVFIDKRQSWGKSIRSFIIGHANYEMLTQPYIGLTGKVLFIEVDVDFFSLDLAQQYCRLDEILVQQIESLNLLQDNRHLSPLPLLGVPSWWPDNENVAFYDNSQYFRAKPSKLKK